MSEDAGKDSGPALPPHVLCPGSTGCRQRDGAETEVFAACEAVCLTETRPPLQLCYKMVHLFPQTSIGMKPKGDLGAGTGEGQGHSDSQDAALPRQLPIPCLQLLPSGQMTPRTQEGRGPTLACSGK